MKKRMALYPVMFLLLMGCNSGGNNATNDSASMAVNDTANKLPPPNPERNCYFGDLHLHTSLSCDAFLFGAKSLP